MIDHLKTVYGLTNFQQWKEDTGISFNVTMNEDTGQVKQITRNDKKTGLPYTSIEHRAIFEKYELTVNEITHSEKKTKYNLTIDGSLHKNHFGGQNYSRFTFADVCNQINYLCLKLHLNPEKCILKNFEYGFNLPVKFNPIEFLNNNLIHYQLNPFSRLKTESKVCIGYDCGISEYRIKIYDKGLQNDLPQYLMRFEKAYSKMTSPKKIGIVTLADLAKLNFLKELQKELLQAWNDILFFDCTVFENKNLSTKDENFLRKCEDANFWKEQKRSTRKKNKEKFLKLLLEYGSKGNVQNEVKELLINEFKKCTVLPSVENNIKKQKVYGFTVNIDSKTVHPEKRYCVSCRNELNPAQKINSKYCSEKYVGYERAHQCRNNNSNPRNNFKNKIKKIEGKGLLFDIMPFIKNKNQNEQSKAMTVNEQKNY